MKNEEKHEKKEEEEEEEEEITRGEKKGKNERMKEQ